VRLLETCAVALGCSAAGLFLAGAFVSGMVWAGVAVSALALVAVLAFAWLEHVAAQRRSVILEAWEQRLDGLETQSQKLRAEVDTIQQERALSRM